MYDVNIILSILSADPKNNQQFVLSSSDEKIIFPIFNPKSCDNLLKEIIDTISTYFSNYNRSYRDSNKLLLLGINSDNLNNILNSSSNTINILYGITIPKYQTQEPYHWKDFSFHDVSIPNELCIIGETIRYGF